MKKNEFKSVFQLKTYKSAFDVHKVQLSKLVTLSAVDTKQLSTWLSIQPLLDRQEKKQTKTLGIKSYAQKLKATIVPPTLWMRSCFPS